ncbi:MAG: signal peptidase I [Pirellulales bacterium]
MSAPTVSVRSPLVAVILSLLATGLGQIYCGHIVRGLVLFLGSLLFTPAILMAALLPPSTAVLVGLGLALLGVLGIYIFAIVDALLLARRGRDDFQPQDYNRPLVYALFILVGLTYPAGGLYFIRSSGFEAFKIPTASEAPSLLPGDRILVNKSTYQRRFVRRGDEVVFRVPSEPGRNWVKRVIALPGDTVEVKDNLVIVNGQQLPREPAPRASLGAAAQEIQGELFEETNAGRRYRILLAADSRPLPDYAQAKVPEGACFVLGDNRNNTRDSRTLGFVALGDLLGDVQYRYWPAATWARFGVVTE